MNDPTPKSDPDAKPSHWQLLFNHVSTVLGKPKDSVSARDLRVVSEDPKLQAKLDALTGGDAEYQRASQLWQAKAMAKLRPAFERWEAAKDELESLGFVRPDSVDAMMHLARVIEVEPENETAGTLYEKSVAWFDRQRLIAEIRATVSERSSELGHIRKEEPMADEEIATSDIELLDSKGSGLKSNIYRARQISLNRIVALKIIKSDFGGDAIAHGQRMAKLDPHPNVVTVHAVAAVINPLDEKVCNALVMEWLEGTKLADFLGRRIKKSHAKKICNGIIAGVRHFHRSGVAHSDLHVGNVMILTDFTPKIIDADEERYSTLNRLTSSSEGAAISEDVRYCRDLVYRVCSDSELDYNIVMEKAEQFRAANTIEELETVVEELFSIDVQVKTVDVQSPPPSIALQSQDIMSELKRRVEEGRFWGLKQEAGSLLIGVVAANEATYSFEEIRREPPEPIFPGSGWGYQNRAKSVASIQVTRSVVRSVVEIDCRGRILAVDRHILDPKFHPYDDLRIPSTAFASMAIKSVANYLNVLVKLGHIGKLNVHLSLTNISDYLLDCLDPCDSAEFYEDEISPSSVCFNVRGEISVQEVAAGLKPIFDHIWREFGLPNCLLYLENGVYSQRII